MNWSMRGENFSDIRKALLEDVGGEVLEIGFGSGLNLPHYSDSVRRITTFDPNPGANHLARKRIQDSRIDVHCELLSGESLPLDAETFDSVVSTWTLCSIPDVSQAIREIYRVLRPDGRFFFVEHGLSDEPRIALWQHRLTPLQKKIGDGCHLDRNIEDLLRFGGFHFITLEKFYMEKVPRVGGYLYRGIAAKPQAA